MNTREAKHKLKVARTLLGTGMIQPVRPDKAVRSLLALRRWGPTPAAAYTASAIRYPDRKAIVDERGTLTFAEVDRRTNALARALRGAGISEQDARRDHVPQPSRIHRGDGRLLEAGAGALYLNTAFAGPQIADVMRREDPVALIYDEEFGDLVGEGGAGRKRFVAWHEPGERPLAESDPAARGADRARSGLDRCAAGREGPRGDPHVGHDRARRRGRRANSRTRWSRRRRCSRRSR